MVDDKNIEKIPVEDQIEKVSGDNGEIHEADIPDIEAVSVDKVGDNEPSERSGDGYQHRSERRHEPSFEEKMRSFKKQSEERLLHIKRSREAKIGKKKTR